MLGNGSTNEIQTRNMQEKNTTANLEEPNTGDNQRAGMIVTFDPTCIGCRGLTGFHVDVEKDRLQQGQGTHRRHAV